MNLEICRITHFSSDKDYILAHFCDQDVLSLRQRMSVVEQEAAPYGFLRIHVRYLINLNYVEQYDDKKRTVVMEVGTELPISRGYLEGARRVLGR